MTQRIGMMEQEVARAMRVTAAYFPPFLKCDPMVQEDQREFYSRQPSLEIVVSCIRDSAYERKSGSLTERLGDIRRKCKAALERPENALPSKVEPEYEGAVVHGGASVALTLFEMSRLKQNNPCTSYTNNTPHTLDAIARAMLERVRLHDYGTGRVLGKLRAADIRSKLERLGFDPDAEPATLGEGVTA